MIFAELPCLPLLWSTSSCANSSDISSKSVCCWYEWTPLIREGERYLTTLDPQFPSLQAIIVFPSWFHLEGVPEDNTLPFRSNVPVPPGPWYWPTTSANQWRFSDRVDVDVDVDVLGRFSLRPRGDMAAFNWNGNASPVPVVRCRSWDCFITEEWVGSGLCGEQPDRESVSTL